MKTILDLVSVCDNTQNLNDTESDNFLIPNILDSKSNTIEKIEKF